MKRLLAGLLLTIALLIMVTGTGLADDSTETPITGLVQSVVLETDPETSVITAVVTLVDELGETQVVRISLETAVEFGLVDLQQAVVEIPEGGIDVTIEATDILNEDVDDGSQHPVATALSDFFSTLLGVDYDTVMAYHEDGIGFGVIAQALWMTKSLEGDTALLQVILDAKKSGDFSAVVLPDGSSPANWGQFRQAVLKDKEKAKNNLGAIKSGRAEADAATDTDLLPEKPDKANKDKDKEKDKGKGQQP
jgi:hypothetical protein